MPYTPPASNAVDITWQGAATYTPPTSTAADLQWAADVVQARGAVPGPLGQPALVGIHAADAIGVRIVLPGPLGNPAARVYGVVAGRGSVPSPLSAPAGTARVVRYQLRGEVRNQGVLVDRRVRAYRRSDGALVAQADTAAGRFSLDVGFAADEFVLLPIHLDPEATDFAPPAANRVVSVLAQD